MYQTMLKQLELKRKLEAADLRCAGLPERFWDARLDAIPKTAPHYKDLTAWCGHAREMCNAGIGLWLYGPTGGGKTAAAVICAKAVLRGAGTVWFSRADEIAGDVVNLTDHPEYEDKVLWDYWRQVNLWVVDEVWNASGADQARAILEREIRTRLSRKRAILFTTNCDDEDGIGAFPDQVMRAIRESCRFVMVRGTQFGRDGAKRLNDEFGRLSGE